MTTVKLRPFFSYFGAKWRAAPHYPKPEYDSIVEPFAGAAGYSLRHFERDVHLNDLDPKIMATWDYILSSAPDDVLSLPLIDEFDSVDDLDVPIGAKYLIGYWLNPGNSAPCKTASQWVRDYQRRAPGSVWSERTRARVAEQMQFVKHWTTSNIDYATLPPRVATWFIDPPYQRAGKHYRMSSRDLDFEALAEWAQTRGGQVIVCENEGASWLPFRKFRISKGTSGAGRTGISREVIWEGAA